MFAFSPVSSHLGGISSMHKDAVGLARAWTARPCHAAGTIAGSCLKARPALSTEGEVQTLL